MLLRYQKVVYAHIIDDINVLRPIKLIIYIRLGLIVDVFPAIKEHKKLN